ncbi:hypothetical protein MEO41_28600, partial [Dolichospermum sp. ST_sed4]|nr:hypothetical protein [Dolichospermum sp. ST_sed4]
TTNQYSYFKNARLKTASNPVCVISNNYNYLNRLTDVNVSGLVSSPQTQSYAFDPVGNTTNISSVAGNTKMTFDEVERLSSITATRTGLTPLAFNVSYDLTNGLISSITCTNTGITLGYS